MTNQLNQAASHEQQPMLSAIQLCCPLHSAGLGADKQVLLQVAKPAQQCCLDVLFAVLQTNQCSASQGASCPSYLQSTLGCLWV